jgi:hypothetical protein
MTPAEMPALITERTRPDDGVTCRWFLQCDNPAVGVVRHSVLGNVPCCRRCADKLGLDLRVGA